MYVVQSLISQDFEVMVVDPNVVLSSFDSIKPISTKEAIQQSDIGFKLVNHTEFKRLPSFIINFVN